MVVEEEVEETITKKTHNGTMEDPGEGRWVLPSALRRRVGTFRGIGKVMEEMEGNPQACGLDRNE